MTYSVTVNHDDQPEEVANKFIEAARYLGLKVDDKTVRDVPYLRYELSNNLNDPRSSETVADAAKRGFYGNDDFTVVNPSH